MQFILGSYLVEAVVAECCVQFIHHLNCFLLLMNCFCNSQMKVNIINKAFPYKLFRALPNGQFNATSNVIVAE